MEIRKKRNHVNGGGSVNYKEKSLFFAPHKDKKNNDNIFREMAPALVELTDIRFG